MGLFYDTFAENANKKAVLRQGQLNDY